MQQTSSFLCRPVQNNLNGKNDNLYSQSQTTLQISPNKKRRTIDEKDINKLGERCEIVVKSYGDYILY